MLIAIPTSPRMNRDPTICPPSLLALYELCRFLDDTGTAKRLLPSTLTHTQELGFMEGMLVLRTILVFSKQSKKTRSKTLFFFFFSQKRLGMRAKHFSLFSLSWAPRVE